MAMVARKLIVWHSSPLLDEAGNAQMRKVQGVDLDEPDVMRVEIGIDSVVPDTIPKDIQKEWEQQDWIYEDPTKDHIATSGGPPRVSMPLKQIQRVEEAKKATGTPVLGRTIPPRPSHT